MTGKGMGNKGTLDLFLYKKAFNAKARNIIENNKFKSNVKDVAVKMSNHKQYRELRGYKHAKKARDASDTQWTTDQIRHRFGVQGVGIQ